MSAVDDLLASRVNEQEAKIASLNAENEWLAGCLAGCLNTLGKVGDASKDHVRHFGRNRLGKFTEKSVRR